MEAVPPHATVHAIDSALMSYSLLFISGFLVRPHSNDARVYSRLVKKNLALQNVIQYVQLPMLDADGQVRMMDWPVILPHVLVGSSFPSLSFPAIISCLPGLRQMN